MRTFFLIPALLLFGCGAAAETQGTGVELDVGKGATWIDTSQNPALESFIDSLVRAIDALDESQSCEEAGWIVLPEYNVFVKCPKE